MKNNDQPYLKNPLLRLSYSLIAPLYDAVLERPMRTARQKSLRALPVEESGHVLVSGVGTGLDMPWLPRTHRYTALDFSPEMLSRAKPRSEDLDVKFVLGDSMALPFEDAQFDHVVLHLIVAVVPEPQRCLSEAARVLKPGGTIVLFDKFLQPQQRAPLRMLLNVMTRRLATRMDVVFEEVMLAAPELEILSDAPMLANGWFRGIALKKLGKAD
ncbi:MAG: class I SAM-dependent methyltransferase [Gallionellaceae bacterium]